ncbi:MAG: Ig-like domain-containing protein, partial [Dehalococcoidia bacterium]
GLSATFDPNADLSADTLHTVTVTTGVTDDAGNPMAAEFTSSFTTAAVPTTATTVSVASVTYDTTGGPSGDKHLLITVALVDGLGNQVADASVSIDLYLGGSFYASGTGTTGTGGTVTFKAVNAPPGTYTTTMTDVAAAGLTWDGLTPINEFVKT